MSGNFRHFETLNLGIPVVNPSEQTLSDEREVAFEVFWAVRALPSHEAIAAAAATGETLSLLARTPNYMSL